MSSAAGPAGGEHVVTSTSFGRTWPTTDRIANSRGTLARELTWTVAGASIGGVVRYRVAELWPGRVLASTLVLTAAAAVLIGVGRAASICTPLKWAMIAAGGAAASISAVATQAALATPTQSIVVLAGFFGCAVAGLLLGMLVGFFLLRQPQSEGQP